MSRTDDATPRERPSRAPRVPPKHVEHVTAAESYQRARFDTIECLTRFAILALILCVFVGAELYLEAHGNVEGARRFDVGAALALAGLLDSARVSARKVRELQRATP